MRCGLIISMLLTTQDTDKIASLLLEGKIGVLPTDTIYGLHCLATDQNLIKKIYELKKLPNDTPLITLVADEKELEQFGVGVGEFEKELMKKYWSGPNTLIFDTKDDGTRSFRMPKNDFLLSILKKSGPLVSTSANIHQMPFSKNVNQAVEYFGDKVDFYVDGGEEDNPPSSIYKFSKRQITKIR